MTQQLAASSMTADESLCSAERKLSHHLLCNKLSMIVGLALGAAALTTGLCASQSFFRWAFLLAAAWELAILPFLCAAENRRLRRLLNLVREELRDCATAAASCDLQMTKSILSDQPAIRRWNAAFLRGVSWNLVLTING